MALELFVDKDCKKCGATFKVQRGLLNSDTSNYCDDCKEK